jgi:hypothetical protein
VDFGFAAHLGAYLHGWHQNLFAFGIPLQLGVELKLPVVTLDFFGEAGGGMGFSNLIEYRFGGIVELHFRNKKIGLGVGGGTYGNTLNIGGNDSSAVNEPSIETSCIRFAFIFRDAPTLYAELYGTGNWGFGLMWAMMLMD